MSTTSKRTNKRSRTESESSVSALSQTNSEKDVNAPQESIITESTSSMQSPQIPPSHESNFIFQHILHFGKKIKNFPKFQTC